jgi:hypothetical protein
LSYYITANIGIRSCHQISLPQTQSDNVYHVSEGHSPSVFNPEGVGSTLIQGYIASHPKGCNVHSHQHENLKPQISNLKSSKFQGYCVNLRGGDMHKKRVLKIIYIHNQFHVYFLSNRTPIFIKYILRCAPRSVPLICKGKGKGKVVPVLTYLSTTPSRRM